MKNAIGWVAAVVGAAAIVIFLLALFGYPEPLDFIVSSVPSFVVPVAILTLLVVISNIFHRKDVAQKWTDGRVGVGTIQQYRHSGRYNNVRTYSLTMQVESEDGPIFVGAMNPQVGRRNLPSLSPGTKLPVCFSAAKATQLFVPHGPLKARAQLFFEYVQQRDGIISQTALEAKYRGLPCRATVTGMRQSGYREGGLIQWILDVQVFTPDGQQFPSTARVLASQTQYDRLRSAQYLDGKYAPHDTSEIAVKLPKVR